MKVHRKTVCLTAVATSILVVWLLMPATTARNLLRAEDTAHRKETSTSKEALAEFNSLIGGWRGVAQPKRSSNQGAWKEKAQWIWDFSNKDAVAVRYETTDSRLLQLAVLTYDTSKKIYRLTATFIDETQRKYQGQLQDNKLILESAPDKQDLVYRLTITRLNEKRTLVLHEKRRARQRFYNRIVQIGYTREGTRLASSDQAGPKCIVTGGAGTSKVTYKGKTYYVCCSGCRDAFLDDPEGILEEARARAKQRAQSP